MHESSAASNIAICPCLFLYWEIPLFYRQCNARDTVNLKPSGYCHNNSLASFSESKFTVQLCPLFDSDSLNGQIDKHELYWQWKMIGLLCFNRWSSRHNTAAYIQQPVFNHTSNILFSVTHPTTSCFQSECEKHCQTAVDTSAAQRPFPTWDFPVCVDSLVLGVVSVGTNVNFFPLQLHLSVTAAKHFGCLSIEKKESTTWNAFRQAR